MPAHSIGFHEFADQDGWDYWARKGVYGAHLKLQGSSLFLFTTHMQSTTKAPAAWTTTIQQRQIEAIRASVLTWVAKLARPGRNRVALCGDFNVPAEDEDTQPTSDYLHMCQRLGVARDVYRAHHPTAPGFTYSAASPSARIDYMLDLSNLPFAAAGPVGAFTASRCDFLGLPKPYPEFSDHRPLVADLTI